MFPNPVLLNALHSLFGHATSNFLAFLINVHLCKCRDELVFNHIYFRSVWVLMKFQIIWSDSALKELKKLERSVSKRIFAKVSLLEDEPYRHAQKLVGSPFFKLRVGAI